MKKFGVVVILAVGGYFAWQQFLTPQKRACSKLASLCDHDADQRASCESAFAQIEKSGGSEQSARLASCLADASSCPAGAGCLAGAGISAAGNAAVDFIKGMTKTLGK